MAREIEKLSYREMVKRSFYALEKPGLPAHVKRELSEAVSRIKFGIKRLDVFNFVRSLGEREVSYLLKRLMIDVSFGNTDDARLAIAKSLSKS